MEPICARALSNGLRLVGVPRSSSPLAAVLLDIQVGSADEEPGEEGLAHVLEHLVARCAMDGGRVGDGALITARAGRERTLYSAVVRSGAILEAVAALGQAFRMPDVTPAVLDAELAAIREERRQRASDPAWNLQEALLGALCAGTRYAHPVLGNPQVIDALTPRRIHDFHAAWYRPASATLAVAADQVSDRLPTIARAAATWTTRCNPAIRPPGQPERPSRGGVVVARRGPVAGFAFAEPGAESAASMLACDAVKAAGRLTMRTLPLRGWLCVWAMVTAPGTAAARTSVLAALATARQRLTGPDGAEWLRTHVLIPRLRAQDDVETAGVRAADPRAVICADDLLGCPAERVAGVLGGWWQRFGSASAGVPGEAERA